MNRLHQSAFDGMVTTCHKLFTARRAPDPDPVAIADLATSLADRRIALALANGLPIWYLDRNGNPAVTT